MARSNCVNQVSASVCCARLALWLATELDRSGVLQHRRHPKRHRLVFLPRRHTARRRLLQGVCLCPFVAATALTRSRATAAHLVC
jgi:hypothetical protein